MKICVSFENRVRPDSTGVYFLAAFKQLGHDVTHVLPEAIHEVTGGYDLYVKVDDGLKEQVWNPKLHPSAYYAIDTHIESDWRLKLAKDGEFDFVSVVHRDGLDIPWHVKPDWIPVACDPEQHHVGVREKEYDIAFIGNFHSENVNRRLEAVDAALAKGLKVFHGHRMFKDMAEIYAKSKIVFNCSLNNDANMRVFEAMASGSCLLADWVPDMDRLGFVDGVHYVAWRKLDDIPRLVKDLLANDALRERIAGAGQLVALQQHTYAERAARIFKRVEESQLCQL